MKVNPKSVTKKDLFTASLQGEVLDFGLCEQEDYPALLIKLIQLGLVTYHGQREHRGTLASFRIEKDFMFQMMETDAKDFSYSARKVNLKNGEYLHFTELMEANDYNVETGQLFQRVHSLWVDAPTRHEDRTKLYRKYDFERV